jgi:flagellar motor switch protein FliG
MDDGGLELAQVNVVKKGYGLRKAATFLIGLGPQLAGLVFNELTDIEIEALAREMSKLDHIPSEEVETVTTEFHDMFLANKFMATGGLEYAQQVLVEALDTAHAAKIIDRVKRSSEMHNLDGISQQFPDEFATLLDGEHPQAVAFILSQIDNEQAGTVFAKLNDSLRRQVIVRLARMDKIDASLVNDIEQAFSSRMDVKVNQEDVNGIDLAASILNHVGSGIEKDSLDALVSEDNQLAREVEKRMFTFEMIVRFEDRDIQRILRDTNIKDLAVSLKIANPKLRDRIFENMSERAVKMLQEEIDYLGKVRLRDVESTQLKISIQIKALVEKGEISMPQVSEKEVYV